MMHIGLRLAAPVVALTLAAPLAGQAYGSAVAAGDGMVFVAEPTKEFQPGAVYVYGKSGSSWTQSTILNARDATPGDYFGRAISYSNHRLAVGSTRHNESTGGVFVFDHTADGWTQTAVLEGSTTAPAESYGRVVAMADDIVVSGAWGGNDGRGSAYVFRRGANGTWMEDGFLAVDSMDENTGISMSVATDGNRIVLGFPRVDTSKGKAHVYRHDGNAWVHEAELTLTGARANAAFGTTSLIQGERIMIGATSFNGSGAMIGFGYDAETASWNQDGMLMPFDGPTRGAFGAAASAGGTEVMVSAPGASGRTGHLYAHVWGGDAWTSATRIVAEDTERGDGFGGALAVASNVAVVGATGDDYGAGTAYVFEKEAGTWTMTSKLVGTNELIAGVRGDQINCSEGVATAFDCNEVDLMSFTPINEMGGSRGVRLNDVWGWTDPQTKREFALVGRIEGTSFVDVTDPLNPTYIGDLPMTEGARAAAWRDIKVYRDHAFIVADGAGPHGMQIFNLTQLRDVRQPTTFEATAHYDGIASSHNIVINEATGFAYSVGSNSGGESCGGGLHMINIQNPTEPTFAGCFSDPSTGRRKTGYSHDAQCVSYTGPDREHAGKEICFGSNETALSVADVTDKSAPVALSMISYPNVGYTHQGWLTEDQKYFYMNDELDEIGGNVDHTRTLVWDVSDLDDPVLVKEHMSENQSSDHNLYIRDNLMYQSNYVSGLRILDISEPENPVEVGFFDTVPYGDDVPGFNGSWSNYPFFDSGIVVVTSVREGLFIVKKKPGAIIP